MKKFLIIIFICLIVVGCKKREIINNDFDEISYKVPSEFKLDDDYTFSKYYDFDDNLVYCHFIVHSYEKDIYHNKEKWFKNMININLNDKVSELKEIEINNNKVLYIEKNSVNVFDYYYGFESLNHYYLVDYNINDYEDGDRNDIDTNKCYSLKEEIISSIDVK